MIAAVDASTVLFSLGGLLGVIVSTTLAPLLIARQGWKRQDEVADRLLAAQTESIRRTDEVAQVMVDSTASTDLQLERIHTLVNSNLTGSMEREMSAEQKKLSTMEEHIAAPTAGNLAEMAAGRVRIVELRAQLDDRLKQTELADAKVEAAE